MAKTSKRGLKRLPPKLVTNDKLVGTITLPKKYLSKNYLGVASTESDERFDEIGLLVEEKKLKWSYFSNGMHYYLKLK